MTPESDGSAQSSLPVGTGTWWLCVGCTHTGKTGLQYVVPVFPVLHPSSASLLCDALMGFLCINEYLVLKTCGILVYCIFMYCAADLRCKMSGFSHYSARGVNTFTELFKRCFPFKAAL